MIIARPVVDDLSEDLQWLKNKNGTFLKFKSVKEAKRILKKCNFLKDCDDEELEELFFFEEVNDEILKNK